MENNPLQSPDSDRGRTAAILSYFWFIGWLIAYFAFYRDRKTSLAAFQLRQTLLFHVITLALSWSTGFMFILSFLPFGAEFAFYLYILVSIALLLFWIVGLVGALNGKANPIPFIGQKAQQLFSDI